MIMEINIIMMLELQLLVSFLSIPLFLVDE